MYFPKINIYTYVVSLIHNIREDFLLRLEVCRLSWRLESCSFYRNWMETWKRRVGKLNSRVSLDTKMLLSANRPCNLWHHMFTNELCIGPGHPAGRICTQPSGRKLQIWFFYFLWRLHGPDFYQLLIWVNATVFTDCVPQVNPWPPQCKL